VLPGCRRQWSPGNNAQKTMRVITLALIAHGDISAHHFSVPF
jgi:hypothetical protein